MGELAEVAEGSHYLYSVRARRCCDMMAMAHA